MTDQSKNDSERHHLDEIRLRLWQRRLAIEAEAAIRDTINGRPKPYRETPRVLLARRVLKLFGLFNRGVRNVANLQLNLQTLYCEQLPAVFHGFRILLLSDFHFSGDRPFIDRVCALIQRVQVDVCVMTGDYRYSRRAPQWDLYEGMEAVLRCVRAKFGVVGVFGNNDTSDMLAPFRALGVHMLVNQPLEIRKDGASLWFGGVDDPHEYRCSDLPCAFDGVPPGAFRLLLAHSPELTAEAAALGVDVYLCGHTHGGQIALPWGPLYVNCRCSKALAAGCWQVAHMQGYTTTGLNASTLPVRYNCPPEAVLITLSQRATAQKAE